AVVSDALRWTLVVTTVAGDVEIRSNVFKSLLLNSTMVAPNVGWIYQLLWVLPVVGISFYLNSSWCSVIAKRAYTLQHANPIATSAYRVVMVFTSVGVDLALRAIPGGVGPVASFIFLCWMTRWISCACLRFVWIARGLSLSGRVRHLEERWAYYLAFGQISFCRSCIWGSSFANAAIFAMIFPLVCPSLAIWYFNAHTSRSTPSWPCMLGLFLMTHTALFLLALISMITTECRRRKGRWPPQFQAE
ncbi:hypothetical protein B0H13DRAFT_2062089, partial [Mycena leptocephala]